LLRQGFCLTDIAHPDPPKRADVCVRDVRNPAWPPRPFFECGDTGDYDLKAACRKIDMKSAPCPQSAEAA
jgi:hypothetical protein